MIGIFDSGVGGMTVARAVEQLLPRHQILYFGDLARTPYGSKSPETIIEYSIENTEFLLSQGARVIIVACNSAASVASDTLRRHFNVPIFEVITPAVQEAIAATSSGRIGVIGTRATIRSNIYERTFAAMSPGLRIFSQACPLIVPLVEEGWLDKQETKMILRRYLHPLRQKQIDTLVLGCTHYPLLAAMIRQRMGKGRITLVDSSTAVAENLKAFLQTTPEILSLVNGPDLNRYYVSDVTTAATAIARKIFGRRIDLIKV
jgi:glutamate racemase